MFTFLISCLIFCHRREILKETAPILADSIRAYRAGYTAQVCFVSMFLMIMHLNVMYKPEILGKAIALNLLFYNFDDISLTSFSFIIVECQHFDVDQGAWVYNETVSERN